MQDKKKKEKNEIKARDLKPKKDAKGGSVPFPTPWGPAKNPTGPGHGVTRPGNSNT